MKTVILLVAVTTVLYGCVSSFKEYDIAMLSNSAFPSHNNYVDAFINENSFPSTDYYVKIALIKQVAATNNFARQISILKRTAQRYGADAILILGLNDSGINVAYRKMLGKDVVIAIQKEEKRDHYAKTEDNTITALAIKYKRNIPGDSIIQGVASDKKTSIVN